MGVPLLFTFMITTEENLKLELENVCLLVMLPVRKDTNVLTQFLRKMVVTVDATFSKLTPIFITDLWGGGKMKIRFN